MLFLIIPLQFSPLQYCNIVKIKYLIFYNCSGYCRNKTAAIILLHRIFNKNIVK